MVTICGTGIAGITSIEKKNKKNTHNEIEVYDQRCGPLRCWTAYNTATHNPFRNRVSDLKFSPNGRFLVSATKFAAVKLWSNDATGKYKLLHEWNKEPGLLSTNCGVIVTISACSRYIVGSFNNCVFLLDVKNGCQAAITSLLHR